MKTSLKTLMTIAAVAALNTVAMADDELDVGALEYVDVVETVEGSVWKGFVTEQTPNVSYKIATADGSVHVIRAADVVKVSKQRNPRYKAKRSSRMARIESEESSDESITETDESPRATPVPLPTSGLRIEPEVGVAIPRGDIANIAGSTLTYRSSATFGGRVGYEVMRGNVGWSFGGLLRATSWRLPVQIENLGTHWTIETQVYGRGTYHMGRVAPFAGLSLGLDTNQTESTMSGVSVTAMGFGMNVQGGVTITASRSAAIELGVDFHPGTDTVEEGVDMSVSYFAFRLGASLRM